MKIQPVIMSGGAGTRLWPVSRREKPKQFLALTSERSLFQESVLRVSPAANPCFSPPVIIGATLHRDLIDAQLHEIGIRPAAILLEPCPRNTAAVAAVAAAWGAETNSNTLILLTPADHHIEDLKEFHDCVAKAARAAQDGRIVTFGIKAVEPHTGYGYIQQAEELAPSVYAVAAFKEKPDDQTAKTYLNDGGYFWNAGIFLFSPQTMLEEITRFSPDIHEAALQALRKAIRKDGIVFLDKAHFSACPSDSIDYAVLEKTNAAAVVAPVDIGWSDIGSWTAVKRDNLADDALVQAINCKGCSIHTDGQFVGAIGLEDIIIVATENSILVTRRDEAQDVKKIVQTIKEKQREDLL